MNVDIVLSNGLSSPLSLLIAGETITLQPQTSISESVAVNTVVTVQTTIPIVVRKEVSGTSTLVPIIGTGQFPTFIIDTAGTYAIFPEGAVRPDGPISVKRIVDRILDQECVVDLFPVMPVYPQYSLYNQIPYTYAPPMTPGPIGPQQVPFGSGLLDYWGQTDCEYRKYQEILGMLHALLDGKDYPTRIRLLNTIVTTRVPGCGIDEITMLEAAVFMREPALVARLLSLGADPNLTTSGIPLVEQLLEDIPRDIYDGTFGEEQAIIDLLLRVGAEGPCPRRPFWGNNYMPYYGYGAF